MDWLFIIQVGTLIFWAVWLTVVTLTNLFDGLKAAGWLPESWRFASGNFAAMRKVTDEYNTPLWVVGVLFAGVTLWELLAAILMWRAVLTLGGAATSDPVYAAFALSLALWAGFIMADEIFDAYEMSHTHMVIFGVQLINLLVIVLLP